MDTTVAQHRFPLLLDSEQQLHYSIDIIEHPKIVSPWPVVLLPASLLPTYWMSGFQTSTLPCRY